MNQKTKKLVEEIKEEILSKYTSNIEGILVFGGHSAGFVNQRSDLDIWIIFKTYSDNQYAFLKKLHKKYRPQDLSLQAKWLDELEFASDSLASHKGNGHFMIWELHRAIVVCGNNPYKKIKIEPKLLYQSVVVKVEKILTEYRKILVKEIELTQDLQKDIFKHIIRCCRYMVLAQGKIPRKESLMNDLKKLYPKTLTPKQYKFIAEMYANYNPSRWSLDKKRFIFCLDILRSFYLELISHKPIMR